MRLYVRDLEGGAVRPISPEGFFASAMSKAISPDGRLALGAAQGPRREGDALFPDRATVILLTDGSGPPRVAPGVDAKREAAIRWTEDGRGIFVFERAAIPFDIFKVDLATGARTPWMRIAPADLAGASVTPLVRLSADGTVCAYSLQRLLSELYLLDGLVR
jgi:Tol biopolymer transport system component